MALLELPNYPKPSHLVRVFQYQEFAFLEFEAFINDATKDSPGVVHIQVNLCGQLVGFELLRSEDDML